MSVLLALLVAGCASGIEDPAPRTASPRTRVIAAQSAAALKDGRDVELVATLPASIDGNRTFWLGADARGTVYGEIVVPAAKVAPGSMAEVDSYSQPVLIDLAGKVTHLTPPRTSGTTTQMTGADADDEWVTWLESASVQAGSGEWTLYSYERATQKLRVLGSYEDEVAGEDSFLDYDGRPEILGGDVVMGIGSTNRGGKGSAVLSAPLDGSRPLEVLVPTANDPDADEDGFSYVQGKDALMYRDAATGRTRELAPGDDECQRFRFGVLLTCDRSDEGVVVRLEGTDIDARLGPFGAHVGYVELEDGWASFVTDPDGDPRIYAVELATSTMYETSRSQNDWNLMGHGYAMVTHRDGDTVTGNDLVKLL
ncbi:hypothetical protein GEV29_15440 [Aeromicrobium sp. SMF47]|uniref:hypothetical protein n=1 Tax=Aeromicrobium yanjiei TaxID=2662028 RepID=UPI00129E8F2B|nr:hypothetical protein [Aeromicrobium yanjiei]MRJ77935.1 hypothetical protein [Aeromicrobium yanjiei]